MEGEKAFSTGMLWRAVVNFLGDADPSPRLWLPLFKYSTGLPAPEKSYLSVIARSLGNRGDCRELLDDIRLAQIAYDLWQTQSATISQWLHEMADRALSQEDVVDWWFHARRKEIRALNIHLSERLQDLLTVLSLPPDDLEIMRGRLIELDRHPYLHLFEQVQHTVGWVRDLRMLQSLAAKTWPAVAAERQLWTIDDYSWVREYYADQQPELEETDGFAPEGVDPYTLRPTLCERGLGFGMTELGACMYVLLRSTTIDLLDEVLDHARYPSARGSLRCVECGIYAARHPYGYGQLYCSESCKKRAAKRRYRARGRPPC